MADVSTKSPIVPLVLWAQRKDRLLVTVSVEDISDPKIDLTENTFKFSGVGGANEKHLYAVTIEFLKPVNPEKSKQHLHARGAYFEIYKKDENEPFWARLTNGTKKEHWLKTDFNRWKDEDDSDAECGGGDSSNMDLEEMMKNMGGMSSNMNGGDEVEEEDSDDEMPDLE